MRTLRSVVIGCIVVVTALAAGLPAFAADSPGGRLAGVVPVAGTPQVLDGRVQAVEQVAGTTILGGTFTSARNDSETTALSRSRLLAFDTTTKRISTSFLPQPNGEVTTLLATGDGTTVYVGGNFTSIGGVARKNLARVRVSDGAVVGTFDAGSVTGKVNDLRLVNGRLWVAGSFTHVAGNAQLGLATVNPTTGAFLPYMRRTISGLQNGGFTSVLKIDVTPDGRSLVAIGNFTAVDGLDNHQLAMFDIAGASAQLAGFQTTFYARACNVNFNTYMRDVAFSPDGSYFVVVTTGGYGSVGASCDSSARFETASRGAGINPSWQNNTGGDTQTAVEITDSVIYVGGHPRWQNNPFARDAAGPGAVSRQGLAALNPLNGLPLTWNPTRDRGYGVLDFLVTPGGLWVGSDTDRIGAGYLRSKIALMPFTGEQFPAYSTPGLPNDVYAVDGSGLVRRSSAGGTFSTPTAVPGSGLDGASVKGAFMLNGQLYVAAADGTFTRRTFTGASTGAPVPVNTADQIVPLTDWQNDIKAMTGLFYDSGRMYFTLAGSSQLFYRYLSPQSDVVGAQRLVASGNVAGISLATVTGMFKAGSRLYWTSADGTLRSIAWQDAPIAGGPVAGTAQVESAPDAGWGTARSPFLFQDPNGKPAAGPAPPNQAPTAAFTASCTELTCSFDGSSSSDPDGTVASYAWTFGDGTTAAGARVAHAFPQPGSYPVTLTVTDTQGATGTRTQPVEVTAAPVSTAHLDFVGAASTNGNRTSHSVTVPAAVRAGDLLLAYLTTNDSVVGVTGPAGWTDLTSTVASGTAVRVWSRTATDTDAGAQFTATSSGFTKSDLSVAAYRSSGGTAHAGQAASVLDTTLGTQHTTPTVTAGTGDWLVSYWSREASTTPTWTQPGGQVLRTSSAGTGTGNVSAILTDGGAPVAAGTVGGLTATTSEAVSRAPMVSVVVSVR